MRAFLRTHFLPSFRRRAAATAVAATIEQVHITYATTSGPGAIAVDFVSTIADGMAQVSYDNGGTWITAPTSSFNYPTIGWMHQAVMNTTAATVGQEVIYRVGSSAEWSSEFTITPRPKRDVQEIYCVFGDFGAANDVSMPGLIADAKAGVFDSVL